MAKQKDDNHKGDGTPPQPPLNRRLYARFPVRLAAKITPKATGKEIEAEIRDISLGGALVAVDVPIKNEVRIRFSIDGVSCVFDAYVVREAEGPREVWLLYGIEFHPNPEMEKTLKGLLPPKS